MKNKKDVHLPAFVAAVVLVLAPAIVVLNELILSIYGNLAKIHKLLWFKSDGATIPPGGEIEQAPGGEIEQAQNGQVRIPSRQADIRRWRAIWKRIMPQVGRMNYKDMSEWLTRIDKSLACSDELLADIIKAGEAGKLD